MKKIKYLIMMILGVLAANSFAAARYNYKFVNNTPYPIDLVMTQDHCVGNELPHNLTIPANGYKEGNFADDNSGAGMCHSTSVSQQNKTFTYRMNSSSFPGGWGLDYNLHFEHSGVSGGTWYTKMWIEDSGTPYYNDYAITCRGLNCRNNKVDGDNPDLVITFNSPPAIVSPKREVVVINTTNEPMYVELYNSFWTSHCSITASSKDSGINYFPGSISEPIYSQATVTTGNDSDRAGRCTGLIRGGNYRMSMLFGYTVGYPGTFNDSAPQYTTDPHYDYAKNKRAYVCVGKNPYSTYDPGTSGYDQAAFKVIKTTDNPADCWTGCPTDGSSTDVVAYKFATYGNKVKPEKRFVMQKFGNN